MGVCRHRCGPGGHGPAWAAGTTPAAPGKLHADKGYDSSRCRTALRRRGISPRIARRGVESNRRLGRHRWEVERTLAWLLGCRGLTVRHERRADLLQGLLHLACLAVPPLPQAASCALIGQAS